MLQLFCPTFNGYKYFLFFVFHHFKHAFEIHDFVCVLINKSHNTRYNVNNVQRNLHNMLFHASKWNIGPNKYHSQYWAVTFILKKNQGGVRFWISAGCAGAAAKHYAYSWLKLRPVQAVILVNMGRNAHCFQRVHRGIRGCCQTDSGLSAILPQSAWKCC